MSEQFTIRDVIAQVKDPEVFVRSVLRNLFELRDFGEWVEVQFAAGKSPPDYRVFAVMDSDPDTGGGMTVGAFSGRTHKPISEDKEARTIWSAVTATHSEVSALLGELRSYQLEKDKT